MPSQAQYYKGDKIATIAELEIYLAAHTSVFIMWRGKPLHVDLLVEKHFDVVRAALYRGEIHKAVRAG